MNDQIAKAVDALQAGISEWRLAVARLNEIEQALTDAKLRHSEAARALQKSRDLLDALLMERESQTREVRCVPGVER